jgi:hypothetical protein
MTTQTDDRTVTSAVHFSSHWIPGGGLVPAITAVLGLDEASHLDDEVTLRFANGDQAATASTNPPPGLTVVAVPARPAVRMIHHASQIVFGVAEEDELGAVAARAVAQTTRTLPIRGPPARQGARRPGYNNDNGRLGFDVPTPKSLTDFLVSQGALLRVGIRGRVYFVIDPRETPSSSSRSVSAELPRVTVPEEQWPWVPCSSPLRQTTPPHSSPTHFAARAGTEAVRCV